MPRAVWWIGSAILAWVCVLQSLSASEKGLVIWPLGIMALGLVPALWPLGELHYRAAVWTGYLAVFLLGWTLAQPGFVFESTSPYYAGTMLVTVTLAAGMLVGHSKPESIDYRTTIGKNWPFVALMVLGLFLSQLSGETGSAGRMFRFFTEVLGMNDSVSEVIVFWVRKGVHVGFYGALAWLAAKWMANRGAETKWVLASGFLWSGAHGAYDEFFQASVPSRTGSVGDFLLDMLGAAMFLAPYWWPLWRNRHNQSR